jgi:O-antigen/teichoic acid export membrane protein
MHLGLGQVATTILTILLSAAVGQALSTPDFALMYLVTSIATFAYVIADWGYGPYIIREAARNPDRAGELLGSALALRVVVAMLACGAAIMTTWALGYDARTRLLAGLLIIGWLPQYLGLSFGWVFRSRERMDRDAQLNVVHKLTTLLFSLASLSLDGRLEGLILAWSLSGCVTLVFAVTMYRRMHLPRIAMSQPAARALLYGGAPIFMMTLAVAVEPFLNANILYARASVDAVAWFQAAWVIAGSLLAPAAIVGSATYPRLSTAASNPVEFKRAFDMSFRPLLLLAVLGSVGTYLFADVPVQLIYRSKFGPAADTLRAFAPVLLLMYVDVFLSMSMLAVGKASRLAAIKVASVALTAVLVFILVPVLQARTGNGGLGVMLGMTCGELLMFAASWTITRDVIDRRTFGDMGRGLAAGAATLLLLHLLSGFSPFLTIPLCLVVFGGASLLVGAVRKADVDLLLSSVRR